jgi:hypothetical protein
MHETRPGVRTAERVAGVIAIISALVVLNGAWVNQHTWQNVSWRVAMAAVLAGLAIVVETNVLRLLQSGGRRQDGAAVPEFLRVDDLMADNAVVREASSASAAQ